MDVVPSFCDDVFFTAQVIMTSYARLTPYEVGQIKAHHAHGMVPVDIAGVVVKTDGAHPTHSAVSQTLSHLGRNGTWRGDRKATDDGRQQSRR